MVSFTTAQLTVWLALLPWPFARVLALLATAPVIGGPQVPTPVKIGLAIAMTALVAPVIPAVAVDPVSGQGLLLLAREFLVGTAMGFAMRLVFAGISAAGDMVGLQMGLSFAQFYDPQTGGQSPVTSQFLVTLASLVYLSLDGHLMTITALVESFRATTIDAAAGGFAVVQSAEVVLRAAVTLSLPVVATLLIVNAALGVLARAARQLNVFSVGFPITLAAGIVALMLALPYCIPAFERFFDDGSEALRRVSSAPVR